MKHKRFAQALITFAIILCVATQVFVHSEVSGEVIKVSDGDTITVLAPGYRQA